MVKHCLRLSRPIPTVIYRNRHPWNVIRQFVVSNKDVNNWIEDISRVRLPIVIEGLRRHTSRVKNVGTRTQRKIVRGEKCSSGSIPSKLTTRMLIYNRRRTALYRQVEDVTTRRLLERRLRTRDQKAFWLKASKAFARNEDTVVGSSNGGRVSR